MCTGDPELYYDNGSAGTLKEKGILSGVMERVMERIDFHLRHRAGGSLQVEAIVFSTEDGILGKTKRAEALLKEIRAGAE